MTVWVAAFLLLQDVSKPKDELKSAISQGNPAAAQGAIDALSRIDSAAAVDALLAGIGSCKKEELDSLEKRKDLESKERRASEEYQKHQETVRKAMQEYTKDKSQASLDKYKKASEESAPYVQKMQEARKAHADFMVRVKALAQIREAIVASLSKVNSDAAVQGLIERFKSSPDWSVRAGIAGAFESMDREDVLKALVDQLRREKEPTVKVAILDALNAKGKKSDEIVQAVVDSLKTPDAWQVQFAALEFIRKNKILEAIDAVIEAMAKADGRLLYDFQDTLVALTGVDKGIMADAWKAWWDQNKEAVRGGTYKPRDDEKGAKGGALTKFFGIPVKSKRVIFALDRSGSMSQPADFDIAIDTGEAKLPEEIAKPKGNRKIDIARWQLKKVLYLMPDGAMFDIIFFSNTFELYKDKLVKLDKKSREEAFAYIDKIEPQGGTNIFDSLERALSFAMGKDGKLEKDGIDTVYLMSDGMPNQGKFTRPDDIRREIKQINENLKVAINTVLIDAGGPGVPRIPRVPKPAPNGQPQPPPPPAPPAPPVAGSDSDEEFMKKMAEENAGQYSAVKRRTPDKLEASSGR